MKDYCKYVDVFYENGEVDHQNKTGLASRWLPIKALCGNTIPHATLPFGKMSVGPYSGGYPTGYGNHYPNCCGDIKKLFGGNMAYGFSHLHQSGTGAIRYYYNYAVTTPFYRYVEDRDIYFELKNESARPGYYSCEIRNIFCEFTVSGSVALHHYRFGSGRGRIAIDFSNDGLYKNFGEEYYGTVKDARVEKVAENKVYFSGLMSGVRLYFCALFEGDISNLGLLEDNRCLDENVYVAAEGKHKFGVVADLTHREISLKIAYSTISCEDADNSIKGVTGSFEEVADKAYEIWNKHLSVINITTDTRAINERFYSNLYHSLVKPCDMTGENVLGVKGDLVTDLATLWDQYKTLYPLIFTFYPDMGKKLASGIVNISRSLGKIPCSLGISDVFPCEEQAKMLGIFALLDAYYSGWSEGDSSLIDECIGRELSREDFKVFLETGFFERATHILDTTDACLNVAAITEDKALRKTLLKLAENWKNAYDKEDGLMSRDSRYYEGDRYTYSFRLQANMEERIQLAGGKERFVKMLDSFFGFGKERSKPLNGVGAGEEAEKAYYNRFEGFNNECDMEAPYAYIYADRNDRTCEIVHASITDSFLSGSGGLPGNNDSGGLSSCYVWNVLGIFPVAGKGEFLIGAPHIKKAELSLSSGNRLEIEVNGLSKNRYIVSSAEFNGNKVENFIIKTADLMKGGRLVFNMK